MTSEPSIEEFATQVKKALANIQTVEGRRFRQPEFRDYHNNLDRRGGPLHRPEPYDDTRASTYDVAMAEYAANLRLQKSATEALDEAQILVERTPMVRERICAALQSVSDDAKDLAKLVSAALLPLALTGSIALSATPLAFAAVVLIVSRAGVKGFCADAAPPRVPGKAATPEHD